MKVFMQIEKPLFPRALVVVILALFFTVSEALPQQKTISITDFGYQPGSRRNVVPAVKEALKQCVGDEPVTLVFPNGRYDFWQDFYATDRYTIGIPMNGLKNVVIDGDGSEFVFHGNMQAVNMTRCENIVLKNFTVDWDFPFQIQGTYLNATDEYIEIEFDLNQYRYLIEDNKFFLVGEGWKAAPDPEGYFLLYDRDTKEILYRTRDYNNSQLFIGKAEEMAPGIVRFYGAPTIKPPKGTYTNIMAGRYMTVGISMSNSKDVYLKDIVIYHALSHGVMGSRCENITMDNTSVKINDKKGRVFSVIADASHFANCKGLIKVINCAHTGAMDDFINMRGGYTRIDSIIDNHTVITSRDRWVAEPDEEIWFLDPAYCQRSEAYVVQSVERLQGRGSKITFTSLPKNVKAGDYMENKTWTAALELRNCSILKQHRARGILVTTPQKVIIEDNYFRTAGAGIVIEGDMSYWFESGANTDVSIRNNVFDNCLTSARRPEDQWAWGEAVICITPRPQDDIILDEPYHKNIRIEDNIFKTFDVPLVHARFVRGLTFKNNEIIRTYDFQPYLWMWQKSSFLLDGCREVVISGNKIHDEYVTRTIETYHMKKSDIKSEGFSLNF